MWNPNIVSRVLIEYDWLVSNEMVLEKGFADQWDSELLPYIVLAYQLHFLLLVIPQNVKVLPTF
jgi:hypothetical protein